MRYESCVDEPARRLNSAERVQTNQDAVRTPQSVELMCREWRPLTLKIACKQYDSECASEEAFPYGKSNAPLLARIRSRRQQQSPASRRSPHRSPAAHVGPMLGCCCCCDRVPAARRRATHCCSPVCRPDAGHVLDDVQGLHAVRQCRRATAARWGCFGLA